MIVDTLDLWIEQIFRVLDKSRALKCFDSVEWFVAIRAFDFTLKALSKCKKVVRKKIDALKWMLSLIVEIYALFDSE